MNETKITELEKEVELLITELQKVGRYIKESDDWVAKVPAKDPSENDPNTNADRIEVLERNIAVMSQLELRLSEVKNKISSLKG